MASILYNFFPTDILPPQLLPVNGDVTRKQIATQKAVVTCEGTMNCNFFPTDLLPPFQLPVGVDMTAQTVDDQAIPAQEGTVKFKGAALRAKQVHSHRDSSSPIVLAPKTNGSRRTTAYSASRDVPPTLLI